MAGFIFRIGNTRLGPVPLPGSNHIAFHGHARMTSQTPEIYVNGKTYTMTPALVPDRGHNLMMSTALKVAGQLNSAIVARGDLQGQALRVASIEIGHLGADYMTIPLRYAERQLAAKPVDSGPVRVVVAAGVDPAVLQVLHGLASRGLVASINAKIAVVGGLATLNVSGVAFGAGHTATR